MAQEPRAEPTPAANATGGGPALAAAGAATATATATATVLGSATYEIIRQRLQTQGEALRERMSRLDARRQEVFGSVEYKLLQADRVVTAHNCVPQDMVQLGQGRFLFGFNVRFGLKKEIELGDVFAVYHRDEAAGTFREADLEVLADRTFITDFKRLYNVYEKTAFHKFSVVGSNLFMKFRVGTGAGDIAVFKWAFDGGGLRYVDGRAESEYRRVVYPAASELRWRTPDRESFRYGDHPHVSIEDRVFVECVGGDLTIKVEDNTSTGEGVYSEAVDDRNQKVDDAEIAYAALGHLIMLKLRPYKEPSARYFIFNEKTQSAVRVDSIGQSCTLLPEGHGLIFPDGYYLATGELKRFDGRERGMVLERMVHAPNGEDSLYVFYSRETGQYVLMPYRLIAQRVEERIVCHGFSLFPNGQLLLFRGTDEPQKHHLIQLRQTPFHQAGYEPAGQREAFLYQVGNKDVVRCLAESNEVLTLIRREHPYAELYADVVKRTGAILDAYPWLSSEDGFGLDEALRQVRQTADQAVDEFDKVRRLQREAVQRVAEARRRCEERFQAARRASFGQLDDYVRDLAGLRQLRGELIALKEIRYVELAQVDELERAVVGRIDERSRGCVKFLLNPAALEPYRQRAASQLAAVEKVARVAEGREIEKAALAAGSELEMLIEIVNGLRIEDATETTRIIDGITAVYSTLNQVKAALKQRLHRLIATEGAAQFGAQMKLLGQSAASYLDLCDTPSKCDEYLNRITVQIEELEGSFADFEEYLVQLAERRTELYEAFEQRKVALVEQRNRRAGALMSAGERILKVIRNRLAGFTAIDEIHTYVASDLMVARVRETIGQLLELGDSVKADDLQGRLKAAQQEATRQLKDRQELFEGGPGVIRLGQHRFNVNTQPLELTVVNRDGVPFLHLSGTKYFEEIRDEAYLATREVWDQEVVSENAEVYRAEYLAYRLWQHLEARPAGAVPAAAEVLAMSETDRQAFVRDFAGARYREGYTKGIHDLDGARIFHALLSAHVALKLARYHPAARACAVVYWHRFCPDETRALWLAKLKGFAEGNRWFPGEPVQGDYVKALRGLVQAFAEESKLYPADLAEAAGEYLFHELVAGDVVVVSREAEQLVAALNQQLTAKGSDTGLRQARGALAAHPVSELELIRDWVRGFLLGRPGDGAYAEEMAALLFCGDRLKPSVVAAASAQVLEGMKGQHPRLTNGTYTFDYLDFQERLSRFEREVVPRFEEFHARKAALVERERARLRLEEFEPRVLTSFVRNRLIDEVYLPLIGDNLAKQIGAAGDRKRTDLMGLLLLISPPGYGKTTLVEYLANRLGIVFVKINGPALGQGVNSLDPEEAPNAAAREEIQKLNLALEMGDNVMLCVDDIQHCSPEFLQKFISLCDAQRKIEGVWRGRPRTYDLRGRKVVVVMAGNPYTESGQRFKLPDMLANRADTYNLGDIIGGHADRFKASYLENAVTSNPVLAPLANKSQTDVRAFIRMAETGDRDGAELDGSYSARETEEIQSVLRKLVSIREVVLRVNLEYIHSAGQADEYRTEPPFRLQGSYRNMNRLAEKVVSIMDDREVEALILDHYRSEAQTLTTGAESNLLKFKELIGAQTPEEQARWDEIKKTFRRNQFARGADPSDPVGRVVTQLSAFQSGLEGIQTALQTQLSKAPAPLVVDLGPVSSGLEALREAVQNGWSRTVAPEPAARETPPAGEGLAAQLGEGLKALREDLSRAITAVHSGTMADKVDSLSHELEMIHSTLATLKDIAAQQRDHLRSAQELLATRAKQGTVEIDLTQEMLTNERAFLERFHQVLAEAQREPEPPPTPPTP
ncbi:MAG: DNA repair ATPase [Verrucomicrobia bacterium]|nr:DNA repair ATPase [Verrucomicrobiota bacterium]